MGSAAKIAKIDGKDTRVLFYPIQKEDKWMTLLENLNQDGDKEVMFDPSVQLPDFITNQLDEVKALKSMTGIQMRMPYTLNIQ